MMLAGTGLFFINEILPFLTSHKSRMLAIARMFVNWRVNEITELLEQKKYAYNSTLADKIINKMQGRYTSKEFFNLLGFEHYDDVDFNSDEGCNIIHDLNYLLPEQYHQQYDFVFENGTIEHIFDIKNAVASTALAVKTGGYVLHISPLDAFNHGFYNFSINFFADFYRVNGFIKQKFFLLRSSSEWHQGQQAILASELPYTHEEFTVNPEVARSEFNKMGIAFFAQKQEHVPEVKIPIQAAYDRTLNLSSRLNNW